MTDSDTTSADVEPPHRGRFASVLRSRLGIVLIVIVGVLAVVVVVLGVPTTRYAVVGLVVKKDAQVVIIDSSTHTPVQGVRVAAGDIAATSNAKGIATLHGLPVGPHSIRLSKQYYRASTSSLMIPIISKAAPEKARLVATGFPLEVVARDRISGAVISGAEVAIGSAKATTDSAGVASIVVAVTPSTQAGTVTKDGYNQAAISVDVAQRQSHLDASLTATGTLRYLSKATGVINVMEANLDGTDAKVVLAGTGSESDDTTTLLTTTDWKYSALLANRSGPRDALYVLPVGAAAPITLDASASDLTLFGWQGHRFFWEATPTGSAPTTMQSYDADTGKKTVIDTSQSTATAGMYFSNPYLQNGALVYGRAWSGSVLPTGASSDLVSVNTSTLASKTVKSFAAGSDVSLAPYQPGRLYVRVLSGGTSSPSYFSYNYSGLTPVTITDDKFFQTPSTFLESPSDKKILWADPRDGKNTIFIGDADGSNPTQIATLSDYTPYGWYGADDGYILLTKNSSELYIAPAGVPLTATNVLKVTDYHKPDTSYAGYGSGYGG